MTNPMDQISTEGLEKILEKSGPEDLPAYYAENKAALADETRPFAVYMKERIRAKGLLQQDVFLSADIPEKYGYRLLSEERHTRKRDVIIRLCRGAGLDLKETQRALRLAGMEPLYPRVRRDAALILGVNEKKDVDQISDLLMRYGFEPLMRCRENE